MPQFSAMESSHTKRHDNENSFNGFTDYLKESGQPTGPSGTYMHEQNGLSEVSGQYPVQIMRTMMIGACAPDCQSTRVLYVASGET